jgi:hypothetical protein
MHLIETTNIDANEYNYFHSISSNEHMIGFIARLAIKLDLIVFKDKKYCTWYSYHIRGGIGCGGWSKSLTSNPTGVRPSPVTYLKCYVAKTPKIGIIFPSRCNCYTHDIAVELPTWR